jgi:hypothetical protein
MGPTEELMMLLLPPTPLPELDDEPQIHHRKSYRIGQVRAENRELPTQLLLPRTDDP